MKLRSIKTVIRCADFDRSRDFYTRVLGLAPAEEWSEPQGRGAIFAIGGGYLETYGMTEADPRFRPEFAEPLPSDKIDVQRGAPRCSHFPSPSFASPKRIREPVAALRGRAAR